MEWILGTGVLAMGLLAWLVLRRRPRQPVSIRFDMQLPSRWAAELTQRTLEGEGTASRLGQRGDAWICQVILVEHLDAERCEKRRAHFDQVAAGRGGECPEYVVESG